MAKVFVFPRGRFASSTTTGGSTTTTTTGGPTTSTTTTGTTTTSTTTPTTTTSTTTPTTTTSTTTPTTTTTTTPTTTTSTTTPTTTTTTTSATTTTTTTAARPPVATQMTGLWPLDIAGSNILFYDEPFHNLDANDCSIASAVGKFGANTAVQQAAAKYIRVPDDPLLNPDGPDWSFTVGCWAYLPSLTQSYLVCKGQPGALEWRLEYNQSNTGFRFWASANGTTESARHMNLPVPVINTWYFIVAEHDGPGNRIGIRCDNGVASYSSFSSAGINIGNNDLCIGWREDGLYGVARITQPFIINRLMTQAEHDWLWNGGNGRRYIIGTGWV